MKRESLEPTVYEPKGDPFFEQLKADVEAGIEAVDQGRVFSAMEVREHFRRRSEELRKEQEPLKN